MAREVREVKVVAPDGNIIKSGEAIPCESLSCDFCGKHICPATQKIYYSFPFSENTKYTLCSVKCIQECYVSDQWSDATKIKVLQKNI